MDFFKVILTFVCMEFPVLHYLTDETKTEIQ